MHEALELGVVGGAVAAFPHDLVAFGHEYGRDVFDLKTIYSGTFLGFLN